MGQTKYFGTDGIRAQVGLHPLVPDFVLRLGLAAGSVLAEQNQGDTVIIGRDTRQSGPMLQAALTAGLLASGITVLDAGVITTPGVAYLVRKMGAVAGVVISASHNPVKENGIKFFNHQGLKLPEALEVEIERRLEVAPGEMASTRPYGRAIEGKGLHEVYVDSLLDEHRGLDLSSLSIVLDCANGAASWFGPECLARLGARLVVIHASPTGLNINDRAGSEHTRQHPAELTQLIQHFNADFGLTFDGDADRAIFVDERGNVLDGDYMLALLSEDLLQRNALLGNTLVTSNMRNQGLAQFARKRGLTVFETPVGDKYITEKLLAMAASSTPPPPAGVFGLGGEQSGHVILLDGEHATGDGIRTALFVISAFLRSGAGSLAAFADRIQKTPQVIASAYVGRGPRLESTVLSEMESRARQETPALLRINLRYSGTEPLFRAMLEADERLSEAELARLAAGLCHQVQAHAGVENGHIAIQNCARGGILPAE